MPIKTLLSWSSGKDSAWALHTLRQQPKFELVGLVTTVNSKAQRVAMHAVREELLDLQAQAAGLPLTKAQIPSPCSNEAYDRAMSAVIDKAKQQGVEAFAFGDLFLEDIRAYREERLKPTGIEPVFPIWGLETAALAREMVASGLRSIITCVDPKQLDSSFAGRTFDDRLLDDLPETVDACGERGEFHSFAFTGPMFSTSIKATVGEIVERDGFVFADVTPEEANQTCPKCDIDFVCELVAGKSHCWCTDLPKIMPMKGGDEGCYCPSCLRTAIDVRP